MNELRWAEATIEAAERGIWRALGTFLEFAGITQQGEEAPLPVR